MWFPARQKNQKAGKADRPGGGGREANPFTAAAIQQALARPIPSVPVVTRRMLRRDRAGRLLARPEPPPHAPPPRVAAVLLPFFHKEDKLHLVFTRRAEHLPHHRGQISFPGGGVEPEDETLLATALREFHEELGVAADFVTVWGRLQPVYVPPSHFTIHPFVGYVRGQPFWKPAPAEVAAVLEIPFTNLVAPGCFRYRRIKERGETLYEPGFAWANHWIWGATAIILDQFLAYLPSDPG